MSVDAGLHIFFQPSTATAAILRALLDRGWRAIGSGIEIVWLGEQRPNIMLALSSLADDASKLDVHLSRGESFSVTMNWGSTDHGGEFIFSLRDQVMFSPSVNRLTLGRRLTDVSWYLTRIVAPQALPKEAAVVESWRWFENA